MVCYRLVYMTARFMRLKAHSVGMIIESNYYPTRFARRVSPYAEVHPRDPRLDLPFSADRFDGVVFADEI